MPKRTFTSSQLPAPSSQLPTPNSHTRTPASACAPLRMRVRLPACLPSCPPVSMFIYIYIIIDSCSLTNPTETLNHSNQTNLSPPFVLIIKLNQYSCYTSSVKIHSRFLCCLSMASMWCDKKSSAPTVFPSFPSQLLPHFLHFLLLLLIIPLLALIYHPPFKPFQLNFKSNSM